MVPINACASVAITPSAIQMDLMAPLWKLLGKNIRIILAITIPKCSLAWNVLQAVNLVLGPNHVWLITIGPLGKFRWWRRQFASLLTCYTNWVSICMSVDVLFPCCRISLLTISVACAIGCCILAGYLFHHRKLKVFKVASPIFLLITLIGCSIMYLEVSFVISI